MAEYDEYRYLSSSTRHPRHQGAALRARGIHDRAQITSRMDAPIRTYRGHSRVDNEGYDDPPAIVHTNTAEQSLIYLEVEVANDDSPP